MLNDLINLREDPREGVYKKARWITAKESYALYFLLQEHKINRYVECGTANGFSAVVAALSIQDTGKAPSVLTYDIADRPKIYNKPPFNELAQYIKFNKIQFHEGMQNLTIDSSFGSTPTAWFIDGHHSTTAVGQDWEAAEKLVNSGDIVIFHDIIEYPGINKLFIRNMNKTGYRGSFLVTERGMGILWKI